MKNLTLFLSVICFCFFQVTSARSLLNSKSKLDDWLDMEMLDVYEKCDLDAATSLEKASSDYKNQLYKFLIPIEELGIQPSDYTFYHIYNSDLLQSLKNLIARIQDCLDEKDRLASKDIVKVLETVLKARAMKVLQLDPVTREDKNCALVNPKVDLVACGKKLDDIINNVVSTNKKVYHTLMGAHFVNYSCQDILPVEECITEAASKCTANSRKMWKVLFSPPEVGICENFLQDHQSNFVDDIEAIYNLEGSTVSSIKYEWGEQ